MNTIKINKENVDFSFSHSMIQLKLITKCPVEVSVNYFSNDSSGTIEPNQGKLFSPPYFNYFETDIEGSLINKEFVFLMSSASVINKFDLNVRPICSDNESFFDNKINLLVVFNDKLGRKISMPFELEIDIKGNNILNFEKNEKGFTLQPNQFSKALQLV